jgi:protein subunit release factor B
MDKIDIIHLKEGTKLACIKSSTVSIKAGYIYTFSNWIENKYHFKTFFQCIELKNNKRHSMLIHDFEIYDEIRHVDFSQVTPQNLNDFYKSFIKDYGT